MAADERKRPDSKEQVGGADLMAERIGMARREAGFKTAQDFAEALAVSVWTVRSWESGKSQPRYHVLRAISQLTGRPVAWFLGENPAQQELERAMEGILERYQLHLKYGSEAEAMEPGVYGIAPFDMAAERELQALSGDARRWGLLIRLTGPVSPATAEQLAAVHLALAGLVVTDGSSAPAD